MTPIEPPMRAINCTATLPDVVAGYVRESLAENTRRAYLSDLAQFEAWGGAIPASPEILARYLAEHAGTLSVATLARRVASLAKVHRARGLPDPAGAELVRATLGGIKRMKGIAQREAQPLLRDDLLQVLDTTGDTLRDVRDRALLLVGFAGGFRRSELVGLDSDDVQPMRQGLVLTVRRSKTDQEGAGRKIAIPHGRTRWCPVTALEAWRSRAGIESGPLFRPVSRHGRVEAARLSGDAVSMIVKERVGAVGLDPARYSGHSLRAGLATSAAQAGVSSHKIRAQTGHASEAMLGRYIRDGQLFTGNAAGALL